MKPQKNPSTLELISIDENGFEIYENASYRLSVVELNRDHYLYRDHQGVLTVLIEHKEASYAEPVIIEEKGFMYAVLDVYTTGKNPIYSMYRRGQTEEGDIPGYVLIKVNKLVHDIRRAQPKEGAKYLAKLFLKELKKLNFKFIKAEATQRFVHLTFLDSTLQLKTETLYEKSRQFPCDLTLLAQLLNEAY